MFGEVVEGMDVVRKIERNPTRNDRPVQPVVIVDCGELKSSEDL